MPDAFKELLEAYRQMWNNRILINEDVLSEIVLKEAIKRELLDGNSHPRVRKSIEEKYLSATKRIIEADLSSAKKVALIQIHIEMASNLKKDIHK
ncbi:hypothetical protein FGG79_01660 [Bacillus sp. BHET2]|uniref:hypothetical protein n=1 Tax=Bacillus sp. BHET2 TaxID=2583818 RepID=UPI00110F4C19|nr:hypothetical protein [Bacillus sp. BHET2]TMU86876.1 hypothetical protein FGG79_01660 [Bacillus sp. BHET2]